MTKEEENKYRREGAILALMAAGSKLSGWASATFDDIMLERALKMIETPCGIKSTIKNDNTIPTIEIEISDLMETLIKSAEK